MTWKVEVVVDDSGEWVGDPLRFQTEQEALAYARDLEFRCSAVRDKRMVKSEDPVNRIFPRQARTWCLSEGIPRQSRGRNRSMRA
jgi:hypothetical protein